MFEFLFDPQFLKSIKKLDEAIQVEIRQKLQFLSEQENPLLLAKKLKGYRGIFRFRAGDYRIAFRLSKRKIILLLVKHRKHIYEGL